MKISNKHIMKMNQLKLIIHFINKCKKERKMKAKYTVQI